MHDVTLLRFKGVQSSRKLKRMLGASLEYEPPSSTVVLCSVKSCVPKVIMPVRFWNTDEVICSPVQGGDSGDGNKPVILRKNIDTRNIDLTEGIWEYKVTDLVCTFRKKENVAAMISGSSVKLYDNWGKTAQPQMGTSLFVPGPMGIFPLVGERNEVKTVYQSNTWSSFRNGSNEVEFFLQNAFDRRPITGHSFVAHITFRRHLN